MTNKRSIKEMKMTTSTSIPIWKEKPPGMEQKELESMFKCNEIDAATTPDTVRKSNPLFMKFNSGVFGAHFRKTKAKLGLSAAIPDDDACSSGIQELGANYTPTKSCSAQQPDDQHHQGIQFRNAPFWTWVYSDHDKKMDFVCVALPIISGSPKINFVISEDGMQITVKYVWPSAIYVSGELFNQAKIGTHKLSLDHAKVHSFISHLLESGVTENSTPHGEIIIDLPEKIKRETRNYNLEPMDIGGTKIILFEFTAYQKAVIMDDADTSIEFK